jgi:hypothetical protein
MEEKITIIEGPPPTFEAVSEDWVMSLNESPTLADVALTRLRTFNGPSLVERCYRAWTNQETIRLEFRGQDGLKYDAPILASRALDVEDGQLLLLWVRLDKEGVELEVGYDDDFGDDADDDFGFTEL